MIDEKLLKYFEGYLTDKRKNLFKKVLEDSSKYHINEKLLLENRFRELQSSVRVLESQTSQKRQELKEIRSNIRKLSESLGYIEEQRKTIKKSSSYFYKTI